MRILFDGKLRQGDHAEDGHDDRHNDCKDGAADEKPAHSGFSQAVVMPPVPARYFRLHPRPLQAIGSGPRQLPHLTPKYPRKVLIPGH